MAVKYRHTNKSSSARILLPQPTMMIMILWRTQRGVCSTPNFQVRRNTNRSGQSVTTESTASLAESITEYRRIHGRTYTQKADYWGPNDEQQNEGLDLA